MDKADEMFWRLGNPDDSGYYLAAWISPKFINKHVSEFWFDGGFWWTSRGYIDQPGAMFEGSVLAWMPKPEVPADNAVK